MKRIIVCLLFAAVLCGCSTTEASFDRAMSLRTGLINAAGCKFEAEVTADYGDKVYTFVLSCQADQEGNIHFSVIEPEYISGIQGQISFEGGKLTFDDVALAFELQADGMLSPVSAPWVMIRALRGGYVRSCGIEEEYLRMTVDDSYEDDALKLDIWINEENAPVQADIYEGNRRILTICVRNFELL